MNKIMLDDGNARVAIQNNPLIINFNGRINKDLERILQKRTDYTGEYVAKNFVGWVYWNPCSFQWHCMVWAQKEIMTFKENSLSELLDKVSVHYGYE